MPITDPVKIVSSHLRWPIPIAGQTYYWIETAGGDFVSRRRPDIYDASGAPTTLSSELATGSIVRIEADERGLMSAVQLLQPIYDNPFARLLAHYVRCGNPELIAETLKAAIFRVFGLIRRTCGQAYCRRCKGARTTYIRPY